MDTEDRTIILAAIERAVRESGTSQELVRRIDASFGARWLPEAVRIAREIKPVSWLEPASLTPTSIPGSRPIGLAGFGGIVAKVPTLAVLIAFPVLVVVVMLFPPFYQVLPDGMVLHMGFHFLFSSGKAARVDASLLGIELLALAMCTVMFYMAAKRVEDGRWAARSTLSS